MQPENVDGSDVEDVTEMFVKRVREKEQHMQQRGASDVAQGDRDEKASDEDDSDFELPEEHMHSPFDSYEPIATSKAKRIRIGTSDAPPAKRQKIDEDEEESEEESSQEYVNDSLK